MSEITTESDPIEQQPGVWDEDVNGTAFSFKRLDTYNPGEGWILLDYGSSGSGKTFFCGTAGPKLLFINIGQGLETLLSPAFTKRYPEATKGIIVVDLTEKVDRLLSETSAFDMLGNLVLHSIKNHRDKFDTIAIDDATFLRKIAMNRALEINKKSLRTNKGKETVFDPTKFIVPEVQDYGREMQMIEWFLATFVPILKNDGINLIMTAHERKIYGKPPKIGDEAILKRTLPGFTGKTFPDTVPAYFDDVWHSEVVSGGSNGEVYRIRTAGNGAEAGKSRHGGIFKTVESDPNFLDMLKRIKESKIK